MYTTSWPTLYFPTKLNCILQCSLWIGLSFFLSFLSSLLSVSDCQENGLTFSSLSYQAGTKASPKSLTKGRKKTERYSCIRSCMWSDTSQKPKPWSSTLSSLPILTGWPDSLRITPEAERKKENKNRALPCWGLILGSKMGFNPFITLSLAR